MMVDFKSQGIEHSTVDADAHGGPWPMGTKSKKRVGSSTLRQCDVCFDFVRNKRISESPAGGVREMYALCTMCTMY